MLSHVQVFCFLASYAVALVLEATRLWFRSGIRGIVMLGFVVAGLIAHTAFLYNSATTLDGGSPLSSYRDWLLLAAWVLVVVYLYLAWQHPATHFGVFFLPLILGLIGAADWFADPKPFPREPASKVWGSIHGTSILLATVTVLFGFAAGLMYLRQAYRLKRRRRPRVNLPSLEWLQLANSRAILASTLLTGIAVASGIELNLLRGGKVPWSDPIVIGTLAMFGWLLFHVIVGAFYRPARQGKKVAYLTIVSFLFLVIALTILFFGTKHGGAGGKVEEVSSRGRRQWQAAICSSPVRQSEEATLVNGSRHTPCAANSRWHTECACCSEVGKAVPSLRFSTRSGLSGGHS